jgi:hypothetical protein
MMKKHHFMIVGVAVVLVINAKMQNAPVIYGYDVGEPQIVDFQFAEASYGYYSAGQSFNAIQLFDVPLVPFLENRIFYFGSRGFLGDNLGGLGQVCMSVYLYLEGTLVATIPLSTPAFRGDPQISNGGLQPSPQSPSKPGTVYYENIYINSITFSREIQTVINTTRHKEILNVYPGLSAITALGDVATGDTVASGVLPCLPFELTGKFDRCIAKADTGFDVVGFWFACGIYSTNA